MAEAVAILSSAIVALVPSTGAGITIGGIGTITIADVIAATAVTAAVVGIQLALTPGARGLSPGEQKQNIRQAVAPRRRVYGRCKVGGVIAFLDTKIAANINQPGTDGQLYSLVMLASHEIDAIEQYFVSDALVTLDANGIIQEDPFLSEGWARGQLKIKMGTADQTAHSVLMTDWPGVWTSNHRLAGIANILGKFGSIEDQAFNKVFPNGIPALRATLRGAKVWDPRASGQSADDPSTWTWTMNAALIIMDYIWHDDGMRLPRSLIELAIDDWIAKINACEELIDGEYRFQLAGVYNITSPPRDILPLMLNAIGGELRMRGDGAIILDLPDYYAPTVIFNDANIIAYQNLRRYPEAGDVRNEIRATFTDPANGYEEQEIDAYRNDASINVDGVQSATLDLTWSPSSRQARARAKLESYRAFPAWMGTLITNAYGLNCLGERFIRIVIGELGLDFVAERTAFQFDVATGRCIIGFRSITEEAFS